MARENQGLQIALIIFVVLTIALGVTTFLFFRSYEEADLKAKANLAEATKNEAMARDKQEKLNHLKQLLGFAITETMDSIDEAAAQDMQTMAANFPEENRFYRPVLGYLHGVIKEKNQELADKQELIQELKNRNEMLEAVKDPQIQEFKQAASASQEELVNERAKFNADRQRAKEMGAELAANLDQAKKDNQVAIANIQAKLDEIATQRDRVITLYKRVKAERDGMVDETFEVAQGEVRWVNQRNRTVWVNLGRADSLTRQTTFSVYDADATDMTNAGKKGSIEITQILGEHLAEGRIIDDEITNPIMPGDQVHTPVWTPGEKKHFVLVGEIDIDDDGQSDRERVRNLIELNGGVVDAPLDSQGKRTGKLTVNTRYMVMGERPDAKSPPALLEDYSKMQKAAEELHIEQISLDELLRRMGWKNQSPVIRFEVGSGASDFGSGTPDSKIRPRSDGNVSEIFRARHPAPPAKSSAY